MAFVHQVLYQGHLSHLIPIVQFVPTNFGHHLMTIVIELLLVNEKKNNNDFKIGYKNDNNENTLYHRISK